MYSLVLPLPRLGSQLPVAVTSSPLQKLREMRDGGGIGHLGSVVLQQIPM
jgi:hypothetical protein